ncbi:MAG: tyrosine--tRNA ligase [Chloroflexi bacterium]|nr:tyrosine--tRNA ligase [Chloroflexota bacterium]
MLDDKLREELLERAVAEIIVKEELIERLNSGRQLRLKQGFDPSKPTLHIGHAVGLRKLRRFQELGHQVVLIVGDWTAQIGDPSGRDESRTMLSAEQVKQNAATYMEQFFRVVDRSRTEVRWQSEWFGKFTLSDVFNLTSRFTLGQMMQHETFRKRWEEGNPLTIMEIMYPILQAYDSVAIRADVEFGGTDQKFNILTGRELQAMLGQPPQDVYLVDLLPGTDGRKMSKSFGNSIDLDDPPDQMYGKVMSLSDEYLIPYFVMATDVPMPEIKEMEHALAAGSVNPRDLKMRLAREIVAMFYGPAAATRAEMEFVRVFQHRELPSEMPEHHIAGQGPFNIVDLLIEAQLVGSRSEARRAIAQGGVRVNGEKVENIEATFSIHDGMILQVGKRRFARLRRDANT